MSYDLKGQSTYDSLTPPDSYCHVCGYEWSVDCICDGTECKECNKKPCECEI